MMTMRCRTPAPSSTVARANGERVSTRLPACAATPSGDPCEVRIRASRSRSRSILAPADWMAALIASMVTSPRVLVLARATTLPAPSCRARMAAEPLASLSNTLWEPTSPNARTETFGSATASGGKTAKGTTARNPAVTNLASLMRTMGHPSIARSARLRHRHEGLDAVLGQRFDVVELGEAAVGEMLARSRAVLPGQGVVHRQHLAHVGVVDRHTGDGGALGVGGELDVIGRPETTGGQLYDRRLSR